MNQMISSENHTGFYTAIGFTLAVILTPIFRELVSFPVDTLEDESDDPFVEYEGNE